MKKPVLRAALFAAGCLMLVGGLYIGEALTVFRKAAMICLECIGIG